jgi:two-component system, OmpR family, sensor histidine kinase VicK
LSLILSNLEENEKEITEVLYGIENTVNRGIQFMQNADEHMDLFGEKNGPSIIIEYPDIYKKNYIAAKNRGVKIRFITEITKDNIHYCKEIREIVTEMRHLEGLVGGIAVTEKEYMTTTTLRNKQLLTQVFYSNAFEVVKQGQYIFNTFWEKAIPAEQRIKEIEEGLEPAKTKVLENQEDIYNHLKFAIKRSIERNVCSSIGGMKMVYDNFFNFYKDIIERQKIKGEGNAIKWLTFIDNDKKSIELVNEFLDAGIQVRHIKNLPSMNFSVDSKSIQATIDSMDKGKLMNKLLVSNEPAYVNHFNLYFQELWNNYGIDAKERIKNIEEGLDHDTEVILHSDKALDLYLNIVQSAQSEILLIFPTPRAFIRQLKPIYLAKQVSKERLVKVRILTPTNDLVEEQIKRILKEKVEENDQNNTYCRLDYFSHRYIEIRQIVKMYQTKATILVSDRRESLVMELKDDTKDIFIQATGHSTHSTSKASVLSYVAIFENLWKQSELYDEIRKSNENLMMVNEKLKDNEKILKEFINIAAHELKNPIQPILGLSSLAKNKTTDLELQTILEVIIRNAKKLKNLSDDILDLSKIESNSLTLNKKEFDIVELLLNLKDEYKGNLKENRTKINISVKLDKYNTKSITNHSNFIGNNKDYTMYADKNRINQVLSNLFDNALRHTLEGTIDVIIEKKYDDNNKKELVINVKDNGRGIDKEILPKLFTKFATTSTKEGTGLGLYISKSIIEVHGGKIWGKNNGDRKGATFSFSLPFANDSIDCKDGEK